MKLRILDEKIEDGAKCYLCRVALSDYVDSIPEDYKDYDVQRGIVSNKYLDRLVDTVHRGRHIPVMVLVSNDCNIQDGDAVVGRFRILDGLQRTHRLKIMHDSIRLFWRHRTRAEWEDNRQKFIRLFSKELRQVGSSSKVVDALYSCGAFKKDGELGFFEDGVLWIELWIGLSRDQEIRKMLLLNAGHKSVNIKHQIELLFLGTEYSIAESLPDGCEIVREKDISSISYSKNRRVGQYHFSHIISSLVALSAGKVVNTNADFVSEIQSDSISGVEVAEGFDENLIKSFMRFLYLFDVCLQDFYGDMGVKWLGREVVLVGVFGAIGAYAEEQSVLVGKLILDLSSDVKEIARHLSLPEFEDARNSLPLNKVNVGNVNKRAVFRYFLDVLHHRENKNWESCFYGDER